MIGIVDYGLGNLRSVAGAVERLGREPLVTSRISDLERAEKLILPGVGAFRDGMANLERLGLVRHARGDVQYFALTEGDVLSAD